jgi:penicillin amidase
MIASSILRSGLLLAGAILRSGKPRPLSLRERLAMIPTTGVPVGEQIELGWSDRQIPFIEARSNRDLAVGLGVVHAHLRLAQMEILRRVSQGRVAEMIGPAGVAIDRALRGLDIGRAVPAIERLLPGETRDWLDGFVAGVNHVLAHARTRPFECRVLALEPEPWSVADVLRLGRLLSADVNWALYFRLLGLREAPDWPAVWHQILQHGTGTSVAAEPDEALVRVVATARSGSNAWAVGPGRSLNASPVLGGDPHLPITVPNAWITVACRSPRFHLCGLMLPGLPVAAIGRSPDIAWGGTNLHAASSDLFALEPEEMQGVSARREIIRVRGAADVAVSFRETRYGPVLTDAMPLGGRPHAFRWVGHAASDEVTALLRLNAARSLAEAMDATADMAIPGQNFVLADKAGRIAKVTAAHLPRRAPGPLPDLVAPTGGLEAWKTLVTGADLPREVDPERGFIVSANDRPRDAAVPIGVFFSSPDRAERLDHLLRGHTGVCLADAAALQTDVDVPRALPLRDLLIERIHALPPRPAGETALADALRRWDGHYDEASQGALAFELLLGQLSLLLHSRSQRAAYGAVWSQRQLLVQDFSNRPAAAFAVALRGALRRAARRFRIYGRWGRMHRLRLQHPFAALPVLGRRFCLADLPAAGTTDSVMKTAHGAATRRHAAAYGSMARYAFDMADIDANQLTLLGGQDGWWGSDTMLDQLDPWRRHEAVQVPLSPEAVARGFHHKTPLLP